jgi:molybdenum cofactor biosynthesis protein B
MNVPMSVTEHRRQSPASVACAVITISDTRTPDTDTSGQAIVALLEAAGHLVVARALVPDDPARIDERLASALADDDVQVVITTGGTGISRRDGTYEVVVRRLEKTLDGFGELFRMLSYHQVGPAAMLSRACAGLAAGRIVIALPGSDAAVRLAMEKLVIPELGHLVREAAR